MHYGFQNRRCGLEGGSPIFPPDGGTCSTWFLHSTGLKPSLVVVSPTFNTEPCLKPTPGSLADTTGLSVDFLSYRYLDVSLPCVSSSFFGRTCGFPLRGRGPLECSHRIAISRRYTPWSILKRRHPQYTFDKGWSRTIDLCIMSASLYPS